jgi:hypothetical protein
MSLVVGAVLLGAGYLSGRFGRRRRRPSEPAGPVAVCGCGHALSQHDPQSRTCHAEVPRDSYDRKGRWAGHTWVACTCRQYVGPRPIDEVFTPRLLPPQD